MTAIDLFEALGVLVDVYPNTPVSVSPTGTLMAGGDPRGCEPYDECWGLTL